MAGALFQDELNYLRQMGVEYARLWPRLIAQNPPWEAYARRTIRKIPVVILHPQPSS